MDKKYAGADWLEPILADNQKDISPIGRRVADLLGQAFRGLYHIQKEVMNADWSNPHYVSINIYAGRDFSTFDYGLLTILVVLCHDAGIRMEIQACNFQYFRLLFHQRDSREGSISQRMPTMEDHIQLIRDNLSIPELVM